MDEPRIGGRRSVVLTLSQGQTVWWCACGKSANQPLCDGSHKGGPFAPLAYTAEKDGPVAFCACKRTAGAPLCDGRHKALPVEPEA